jgi:hypothetical protein
LERNRIELLTRKITRDLAAFGLDQHRASVLAGMAVAAITASRSGRPRPESSWPAPSWQRTNQSPD